MYLQDLIIFTWLKVYIGDLHNDLIPCSCCMSELKCGCCCCWIAQALEMLIVTTIIGVRMQAKHLPGVAMVLVIVIVYLFWVIQ